jgi:CRISPR-associated protein Cas2
MNDRRFWVICYDIADKRRLRRVARAMERYGMRAQKSVFECWLNNAQLAVLKQEVQKLLNTKEDSFRCYSLCADCLEVAESQGATEIQRIRQYYMA